MHKSTLPLRLFLLQGLMDMQSSNHQLAQATGSIKAVNRVFYIPLHEPFLLENNTAPPVFIVMLIAMEL